MQEFPLCNAFTLLKIHCVRLTFGDENVILKYKDS